MATPKFGDWFVQTVTPRDWLDGATLSVEQWLERTESKTKAWVELMQAIGAVTKHEWWEWELRQEPRVAYDLVGDTYYFIFKLNNNGTTFIVSKREMSELSDLV